MPFFIDFAGGFLIGETENDFFADCLIILYYKTYPKVKKDKNCW